MHVKASCISSHDGHELFLVNCMKGNTKMSYTVVPLYGNLPHPSPFKNSSLPSFVSTIGDIIVAAEVTSRIYSASFNKHCFLWGLAIASSQWKTLYETLFRDTGSTVKTRGLGGNGDTTTSNALEVTKNWKKWNLQLLLWWSHAGVTVVIGARVQCWNAKQKLEKFSRF